MATKKATPAKAKAPVARVVKPKFGQVGYEFSVPAKIVKAIPDNNEEFALAFQLNLGSYEDTEWITDGLIVSYDTNGDFVKFMETLDPKLRKAQKQEELKKAQAVVAKLTKELAELK